MPDPEDVGEESVDQTVDLDAKIAAAVDAATSGLKEHSAKLIEEKRAMKADRDEMSSTIEALGGKDGISSLQRMKASLEENELGKLLTEGKHDEWFDQRTEALRAGFVNQIESLGTKITDAEERAKTAEVRHRDLILDIDVQQACGDSEGFLPSAAKDALRLARDVFDYDPDLKRNVIRDSAGGVLPGKDGTTPKTPTEWIEDQKKESRHWWGGSKGVAAVGGRTGVDAPDDLETALANAKTQAEYQRIRDKIQERSGKTSAGFGGHSY